MKPLTHQILTCCLVLGARSFFGAAAASAEPPFFVTVQPADSSYTARQAEASRTNSLCRPAREDQEGNWGRVRGGYQLSLRLNKTNYSIGEPIVATIVWRRVADSPYVQYGDYGDGDFGLLVTDEHKVRLPVLIEYSYSRRFLHGPLVLCKGMQRVYQTVLQARYRVDKPGKHQVYAAAYVFDPQAKKRLTVDSGTVTFWISAPALAPGFSRTNQPPVGGVVTNEPPR